MSWYNGSWSKRLPVTVDNTSNATAALSYYQVSVTLTGAAYAAWSATGNVDGSDIRVTDSDGVTLLSHALEGIDTTNSRVYLLVKVPAVAAASTKTIYVYYGNAGATTTSSYATTTGVTNAITGPTDIYSQSDTAGYNAYPTLIRLRYQDQPNGGGAGHNGDIVILHLAGADANSGANGKIGLMRSTDGGVTYSKATIATPAASHAFAMRAAGELSDGTLLLCYGYDTNTNQTAGHAAYWIAKSTDAGVTWNNLSTSPTNQLAVPYTSGSDRAAPYGHIVEKTPGGDVFMPIYALKAGDVGWHCWLLKCPSGSDPTNGTLWVTQGIIAFDNVHAFGEPDIVQTIDSNHWVAVMGCNSTPFDLFRASSTDGGATWSTPAAVGIPISGTPGTNNRPPSPNLLKLASGNYLLSYGCRIGTATWGCTSRLSTDGCTTFLDRPGVPALLHTAVIGSYDFGYPWADQRADGSIVIAGYHSDGTGNLVNIERIICDEDYLANATNVYSGCESFDAAWTSHGSQTSISAVQAHNGTNSILEDNSGTLGTGPFAHAKLWPTGTDGNAASGVAYSFWCYPTQVATAALITTILDSTESSGSPRVDVGIWSTPYHVEWHNGTAWQDTGIACALNVWQKITVKAAVTSTAAPGRILRNNTDIGASVTQFGNGGMPQVVRFLACSTGSTHNDTWYIDDVYSHQYTANIPVVSIGSEQVNPPAVKSTAVLFFGGAI